MDNVKNLMNIKFDYIVDFTFNEGKIDHYLTHLTR